MDKEQILSELSEAILHNSVVRDQIIEQRCVDYLRSCGYNVIKRIEPNHKNVKNSNDLVQFFYALVDCYYPSPIGYYRNLGKDRKIAKRFVESRMEMAGVDKETAVRQCAVIIEALFKHVNEFNFKDAPINFGIFGQESMGWVTEKLIQLILKEQKEKREEYHRKLEKEILDKVLQEKGEKYLRLEGI